MIARRDKSHEFAKAMSDIGTRGTISTMDATLSKPVSNAKKAEASSAKSSQEAFRSIMADLSSHERGSWGEQAVLDEAKRYGHRILLKHEGKKATAPGYDCVSWDGHTLHLWEAKNYSAKEGKKGIVRELGALDVAKRLANAKQFLKDLSVDDPERPAIAQAIEQDRVQWHIRLGPDTDISFKPLDELVWGSVDVHWYSYKEMMQVYRSSD